MKLYADRWVFSLIVITCVLSLVGCIGGRPSIAVKDAYATYNPMMKAISIFMSIENTGAGGDALIGASIMEYPNAMVELHTVKEGKMVKVDRIDLPAKKTVQLKPGGYHIMGMKITEAPKGELTVVLKFKRSKEISVRAPIRGG